MSGETSPASLNATVVGDATLDPLGATRRNDDGGSRDDATYTDAPREPDSHEASPPMIAGSPRGLSCGAKVGRYVVLAKLGQGGMGVVYAAYDPELDRRVALKLLVGEGAALAEERMQREARAMAQLAHPNVVTVHDVGTLEDRLWIAMEFVDGVTLADWSRERRRGWRDVLDMFLAAGEGLAAAHRAGIVHRDFKPENVMIGADGRARVMDFGLARAASSPEDSVSAEARRDSIGLGALTQVGAVLGTPRYMAPEQWAGSAIDARTDEFAFCMALWEALFGQPPMAGQTLAEQALAVSTGHFSPLPAGVRVPGWVRRACRRGLAVEPDQRWATMGELLVALRRDPAPRRRRLAVAGAVLLLGGGVWAAAGLREARQESICDAAARGLDATWDASARAELADTLSSPVRERAMEWLDLFRDRWSETAGDTCRATTIAHTMAPEPAWQIVACLDERREELGQLVSTLRHEDSEVAGRAATTASELSDPRSCRDDTRRADASAGGWSERAAVAELRRGLARTGVLRRSNQLGLAAATVAAIELRAAAMDAPVTLAAARLEAGITAQRRGDYAGARARLEAAFYVAGAAGADDVAANAAQWLCFLVGWDLGQTEVALGWGRIAEMLLARMHVGTLDRRRASLDADIGVVLLRQGEVAAAMERMHSALAAYEQVLKPEHPDVGAVLNNLAAAYHARGDYSTSLAMLERLLKIEVRNDGPESSNVALTRGNIAALQEALGRMNEAREGFASAAAILEKNRGPEHPEVASALLNLASAEMTAGATDQALLHARRALAIREKAVGPNNDNVAAALDKVGDVARGLGDPEGALAAHRRALAIYERNHGPNYPALTESLAGIGNALVEQDRLDEASAYFVRALAIDEARPPPAAARALNGLGEVALARQDYLAARALFTRAGAIEETHHGREHPAVSRSLIGRGEAELGLGEVAGAIALFERCLRLHEGQDFFPVEAARTRFALARALWREAVDRPRALAEARRARDELRTIGLRDRKALARVEAWLAAPR